MGRIGQRIWVPSQQAVSKEVPREHKAVAAYIVLSVGEVRPTVRVAYPENRVIAPNSDEGTIVGPCERREVAVATLRSIRAG